jgi:hypothetical protein
VCSHPSTRVVAAGLVPEGEAGIPRMPGGVVEVHPVPVGVAEIQPQPEEVEGDLLPKGVVGVPLGPGEVAGVPLALGPEGVGVLLEVEQPGGGDSGNRQRFGSKPHREWGREYSLDVPIWCYSDRRCRRPGRAWLKRRRRNKTVDGTQQRAAMKRKRRRRRLSSLREEVR